MYNVSGNQARQALESGNQLIDDHIKRTSKSIGNSPITYDEAKDLVEYGVRKGLIARPIKEESEV